MRSPRPVGPMPPLNCTVCLDMTALWERRLFRNVAKQSGTRREGTENRDGEKQFCCTWIAELLPPIDLAQAAGAADVDMTDMSSEDALYYCGATCQNCQAGNG